MENLAQLKVNVKAAGTPDGIVSNIRSAIARGLPELVPSLIAHDGHMVVVGSGPSMPSQIENIRAERARGRPIFAVKGAHDFLCKNGIQPDLWCCVDPRDRSAQLSEANAHTVYLVASRCDPSMFDALKANKVILWHSFAYEEYNNEPFSSIFNKKFLVGGGTTSGMRAVSVSYVLGFRTFEMYGFDSCLADDGKTKRFTGEGVDEPIDVIVGGKRFLSNGAMAQQANEFQEYFKTLPDIHFNVHGGGLIAAIMDERKRLGKRV
jgi:uncharacterized Rossmann fold enzyme